MFFLIFKVLLIVFSFMATILSLIFMGSPDLFSQIEEFLGMEFGSSDTFVTVLDGTVNVLNDWVARNRLFFGPLLALLAAINTKNAFFF